jgi:cell division protein FtsB
MPKEKNMPESNAEPNRPAVNSVAQRKANVLIGLFVILGVVYLVGIITGYVPQSNRLGVNEFLLLLLLVLGVTGFFGKISAIDFGEGKFSIKLQEVKDRQDNLEKMMEAVRTALEGIVTKYERQHLEKLLPPNDDLVKYGPHFWGEIERLDDIGYIAPQKANGMVAIQSEHGTAGEAFHLREYVTLTEKGLKYLNVISSIDVGKG